jgi:hypothetical protein
MEGRMKPSEITIPSWTKPEEKQLWLTWIENWVKGCSNKAGVGTCGVWRKAVVGALEKSNGRFHYSGLKIPPLRSIPHGSDDPLWPSIDHVEGRRDMNLAVETRIVNDMKSLLSESEFKTVIGHLAASMNVKVAEKRKLIIKRTFA